MNQTLFAILCIALLVIPAAIGFSTAIGFSAAPNWKEAPFTFFWALLGELLIVGSFIGLFYAFKYTAAWLGLPA